MWFWSFSPSPILLGSTLPRKLLFGKLCLPRPCRNKYFLDTGGACPTPLFGKVLLEHAMASPALASRPRRIGAPRQAPVSIPGTTPHRVLPPRKRPNTYWRSREYLTPAEVDTLISTAKRL